MNWIDIIIIMRVSLFKKEDEEDEEEEIERSEDQDQDGKSCCIE